MKILCIIQARMGSKRLPGKVMKEILGEPMITYTLDRVSTCKYIDEVILATTAGGDDAGMADFLDKRGYKVFCGDEDNVLKRYKDAADAYGGDVIIRVTGDCPFIDPYLIDHVVSFFMLHDFDYAHINTTDGGFLRGIDVEVFSKKTLDRVYGIVQKIEGPSPYKEHVTLYIYRHEKEFSIGAVEGLEIFKRDYRLCVDTEEDFKLVTSLYEHFNDRFVKTSRVIGYLDSNPELAKINRDTVQIYL